VQMSGFDLIAVGTSWGGLRALGTLLDHLPDDVDVPIVIAQHRGPDSLEGALAASLRRHVRRDVREVDDKDPIERRTIYVAPPDYHLLVERGSFALSVDERVQFARPSIDVLFETVADAYGASAIGVVLTGANHDGAAGLTAIAQRGGVAIVQDPESAEMRAMPDAAIAAAASVVLPLEEIAPYLAELCSAPDEAARR
jgi:two-component system, chemotaxis family, protein-glutamate methylesterase/glutaminase